MSAGPGDLDDPRLTEPWLPGDEPTTGLRAKAARAVFWSAAQTWGTQLISGLVFIVLARLLQPHDFGLVALAGVVTSLMLAFADQGFAQAIVQRTHLERKHLDTAFWTTMAIGAALTALVFGIAGPVSALFEQPRLEGVLQVMSPVFLLVGLSSVQEALFRRRLQFKPLALRSLTAASVGGGVGVGMAIAGFGVWSLVAQILAGRGAEVLVLWWATDWRPGLGFSRRHFADLWGFGIYVVGTNVLNFCNRRADDLLIGYFLGVTALGFYSVAYRMLLIMTNLITATLSQVAMPTFARIQHDRERVRRVFYTATQLTSLVSFPAFVGVAILAPEVVHAFFGPQWDESVAVMQVLAWIGILHSLFYFNGAVLTGLGKPGWVLGLTTINAAANIPAFAIAAQWGILAVAIAYVVRGYLLAPLPLFAIRRLIGIDFRHYLLQFRAPIIGSAIMAAAMVAVRVLVHGSDWAVLAIGSVTGFSVYVLALRLIANDVLRLALDVLASVAPRVFRHRFFIGSAASGGR